MYHTTRTNKRSVRRPVTEDRRSIVAGRRLRVVRVVACAWLIVCAGVAYNARAIPPDDVAVEKAAIDGFHRALNVSIEREVGIARPMVAAVPTRGTNDHIVLLVDFKDRPGTVDDPTTTFERLFFTGTNSMADYFEEVSYDQFSVDGDVYPSDDSSWIRAGYDGAQRPNGRTDTYYIAGGRGEADTYPFNSQGLVEDVVLQADDDVDFSQYDNDDDGLVDCVIVVCAGYGSAYDGTGTKTRFRPHVWELDDGNGPGPIDVDGVQVNRYLIGPELRGSSGSQVAGVGVYCHAYGRCLGLPSLYSTCPKADQAAWGAHYGLGTFALMAYGGMGADGQDPTKPTHMCAWSKIYLGWVTPTDVSVDLYDAQIRQIETDGEVWRLWKEGDVGDEYFLVENRQKTGFDADLPGSGLLIYHVDEAVMDGDYNGDSKTNWEQDHLQWDETHKFIDIEAADQSGPDHSANADVFDDRRASGTDPGGSAGAFFSSATDDTFDGGSRPSSDGYGGWTSDVGVTRIGASGATMVADVAIGIEPTPDVDLLIRDCRADLGAVPSTPQCPVFWVSPDIWINNDNPPDEYQDEPVYGSRNYFYARVHNLGTTPAVNVTVDFYYVLASTGLEFPGRATKFGTATIPYIRHGESAHTPRGAYWDIPGTAEDHEHYCIGALAYCRHDPNPGPEALTRNNNLGGVNLGVLTCRADDPIESAMRSGGACLIEPMYVDFNMENPGDYDEEYMLVAEIETEEGSSWLVEFEDMDTGTLWWDDEPGPSILMMPGEVRRIQMRLLATGGLTPHGDSGLVRVKQYKTYMYPNEEGLMGGIDYPFSADCFAPLPSDDLVATVVIDMGPIPGAAPAVRLDFSRVASDTAGNPERVAYYNLYRDTTPDLVPGPDTFMGIVYCDGNPARPGWQYYDEEAVVGPWYDRREEYYYMLGVVDRAGYESAYSHVAGTGNVVTSDALHGAMHEFGGSGSRIPGSATSGDIAWLAQSPETQVYTWQGKLRYDNGTGVASYFMAPEADAFEVIDGAHYIDGEVWSRFANEEFDIVARHHLEGSALVTELAVTNVAGIGLSDVELAWMLDADLEPDFGWGEARWYGQSGDGWQSNRSPTVDPPTIAAQLRARMDGDIPSEWHVGNPSGYLGSTGGFDGERTGDRIFLEEEPFDQEEGPVGLDGDTAILTNFTIDVWPQGITKSFQYRLRFADTPMVGDADGDGDVDLFDYGAFQACFTGPEGIASDPCRDAFDIDADEDVDLVDYDLLVFTDPA